MNVDTTRLDDALCVLRAFVEDIECITLRCGIDPVDYLKGEGDWSDLATTYTDAIRVLEDWRYTHE